MPPRKPDRRTERSRSALTSAFIDLVLTQGYADLTVEDITARANIGRSTFYMHYTGKEAILKQSMTHPSSHLAVIVGHDIVPDALVPILNHFRDQRKRNGVFFEPPIHAIWVRCLAEMIELRLAALVRNARELCPILPLPLIALQIAEAQIALVANWLRERTSGKPEAVAEALIASTQAMVSALLRGNRPLFLPGERLRFIHDSGVKN